MRLRILKKFFLIGLLLPVFFYSFWELVYFIDNSTLLRLSELVWIVQLFTFPSSLVLAAAHGGGQLELELWLIATMINVIWYLIIGAIYYEFKKHENTSTN